MSGLVWQTGLLLSRGTDRFQRVNSGESMVRSFHRLVLPFAWLAFCGAAVPVVAQEELIRSSRILRAPGARIPQGGTPKFATAWQDAIGRGDTNRLKELLAADSKLAAARTGDGDSPLHFAARQKQFDAFAPLRAAGADLESTNAAGLTPMQALVLAGRRAPAEAGSGEQQEPAGFYKLLVLGAKADPFTLAGIGDAESLARALEKSPAAFTARDAQSRTLLHWACECGQPGALAVLLPRKPALDAADFEGRTPLHAASLHGYAEIARQLLDAGAGFDAKDKSGATPLALASGGGHEKIVARLLEKKPALDVAGKNLTTPLHRASGGGHSKVVAQLVAAGARVDARDERLRTPLHVAVAGRRTNAVAELLKHKPALSLRDADKLTPLELAARTANDGVIRLLVTRDVELPADKSLLDPLLHFAAANGNTNLIEQILARGADVNATNESGQSALILAAARQQPRAASLLLSRGANPNLREADGDTALHLANGHEATTRVLLWGGARVDATNAAGLSAFHLAAATNNIVWMDALVSGGADVDQPFGTNRDTALHAAFTRPYYRYEPDPPGSPGWTLFKTRLDHVLRQRIQAQPQRDGIAPAAVAGVQRMVFLGGAAARRPAPAQQQRPTNWVELVYSGVKFFADWANVDPRRDEWPPPWQPWEEAQWRYLLAAGANARVTNAAGLTPMHVMLSNMSFQYAWGAPTNPAIAALVARGADLGARDRDGNTPLHLAVTNVQQGGAVRTLAALKAPGNATNAAGRTPLHLLVASSSFAHDHNDRVKSLLAAGADLKLGDSDGNTPLHLAVLNPVQSIFTSLATNGADFSIRNKAGLTPLGLGVVSNAPPTVRPPGVNLGLFAAIADGDLESLDKLFKIDPQLAVLTNSAGQTPVRLASERGRRELVERLTAAGATLDVWSAALLGRTAIVEEELKAKPGLAAERYFGDTLLHRAAASGDIRTAALLLRHKADVNAADPRGLTPLGRALAANHADAAAALRKAGATESIFDAVAAGDAAMVAALLGREPAAARATNEGRFTALHAAVERGVLEVVRTLLDGKADPSAPVLATNVPAGSVPPGSGLAPLHLAVWSNRVDLAALLLARGANPDTMDAMGFGPLHHAAAMGSIEMAGLLLSNKAAANLAAPPEPATHSATASARPAGHTPLHVAVSFGQTNVVSLLLASGADIEATNHFGITPVIAARYGAMPSGSPPIGASPALSVAVRAFNSRTNRVPVQDMVDLLRKHGAAEPVRPPAPRRPAAQRPRQADVVVPAVKLQNAQP